MQDCPVHRAGRVKRIDKGAPVYNIHDLAGPGVNPAAG